MLLPVVVSTSYYSGVMIHISRVTATGGINDTLYCEYDIYYMCYHYQSIDGTLYNEYDTSQSCYCGGWDQVMRW